MQQDMHVIPESPKEPTESNSTACTAPAAGPGRASAFQPPQKILDVLSIKERTVTGHDTTGASCTTAQPEANQTPPLPPASNPGVSSNEHLRNSSQPLHTSSILSGAEACKQTEYAAFQLAEGAYQPAEFDIVVDAHPAGKSTSSNVF